MKNLFKKVATVLMVAVVLAGVYAPVAKAETTKVIVHTKDGESWGSMNVYNWGDNGETAGVWPGTAMTVESDGWYTYTFETEVDLNLVFTAQPGTPQSSNVDGVSKDAGEIWVVVGGEAGANDLGATTSQAVLFTEAEEGWPTATSLVVVEEPTVEETASVEEAAVPKTGENSPALAITLIGLAAFSATLVVVFKKKEQVNEN